MGESHGSGDAGPCLPPRKLKQNRWSPCLSLKAETWAWLRTMLGLWILKDGHKAERTSELVAPWRLRVWAPELVSRTESWLFHLLAVNCRHLASFSFLCLIFLIYEMNWYIRESIWPVTRPGQGSVKVSCCCYFWWWQKQIPADGGGCPVGLQTVQGQQVVWLWPGPQWPGQSWLKSISFQQALFC